MYNIPYNTHIYQNAPLAHIPDNCSVIFISCAFFTVYPNHIVDRHPTPLQVITTRAREGGPKEHRTKQNGSVKLIQLHIHQGSPIFYIFYSRAASTVTPLSPKATFIPSIQPNLGLPHIRPPLTSAINTLLAIRYSSILSTCPNHLNTL